MKKISKTQWSRYKDSDGKEVIELFEKSVDNDFSYKDMLSLAMRFDPEYFNNTTEKERKNIIEGFEFYDQLIADNIPTEEDLKNIETYSNFYLDLISYMSQPDLENPQPIEKLSETAFKLPLTDNLLMSILLHAYMPKVFFPNFFVMQFIYLKKIASKYDIELPEVPPRTKYFDRCMYYVKLCNILCEFANENKLTHAEMCAFLYDYEIKLIKEEMEEDAVLLLDDVMSELDADRQEYLISTMKGRQMFITTTDIDESLKEKFSEASVFYINNGSIDG